MGAGREGGREGGGEGGWEREREGVEGGLGVGARGDSLWIAHHGLVTKGKNQWAKALTPSSKVKTRVKHTFSCNSVKMTTHSREYNAQAVAEEAK